MLPIRKCSLPDSVSGPSAVGEPEVQVPAGPASVTVRSVTDVKAAVLAVTAPRTCLREIQGEGGFCCRDDGSDE